MIVYFIRSLTAYKGWFFFLVIISALGGLLELVFPLGVRDLLEEGCSCKAGLFFFERLAFLPLWKGRSFSFPSLVPIMGESSAPVWKMTCV